MSIDQLLNNSLLNSNIKLKQGRDLWWGRCQQEMSYSADAHRRSLRWVIKSTGWLLLLGLLILYSSQIPANSGLPMLFAKQLLFVVVGLVIGLVMHLVLDLAKLAKYSVSLMFLAGGFMLLCFVPGIGVSSGGAVRWLDLGVLTVQPVEFFKIAWLIYLANYCQRRGGESNQLIFWLKPLSLLLMWGVVIYWQRDFGSLVVLVLITGLLLFLTGLSWFWVTILVAGASAVLSLVVIFESYRMARLGAFLNPFADPYNTGYQQVQSLLAFGNGGWFGTGLGRGVSKWGNLPALHNDFIISLLAEELGWIGFIAVMCLFLILIRYISKIAEHASYQGQTFGGLLCYGAAMLIALQALIHVGGNVALSPVKGITLPLMSAGGSSMIAMLVLMALVLLVGRSVLTRWRQ